MVLGCGIMIFSYGGFDMNGILSSAFFFDTLTNLEELSLKDYIPFVVYIVLPLIAIVLLIIECVRLPKQQRAFPIGIIAGFVIGGMINGSLIIGGILLTVYYFAVYKRKMKQSEGENTNDI